MSHRMWPWNGYGGERPDGLDVVGEDLRVFFEEDGRGRTAIKVRGQDLDACVGELVANGSHRCGYMRGARHPRDHLW